MPMRRVATAALVVMVSCSVTQARTLDQVPPYLENEGKFVSYPALAVGGLGAFVGAVVSLPAVAVAAPIGWAAGDTLGYSLVPVSVVATGAAEAGYHIGGAIPWVVKNAFYDAPMTVVARIKGEPASGLVAQVEPAPENRGDIQYLETTPPAARVPVVLAQQYSNALPPPKPPTSLMLRRQLSPFKAPPLPVKGAPVKKPVSPPVPPVAVAPRAAPAPVVPAAVPRPQASDPVWTPPSPQVAAPVSPAVATPEPRVVPPPAVVTPAAASLPQPVQVAPVAVPPPMVVAPVLSEPAPVAAPPPVAATPPVSEGIAVAPIQVDGPPVTEPLPASAPAPVAQDIAVEGEEAAGQRPALKKKRKFSERFGF